MKSIERHELTAVAWSWLFFFSVLSAYYVIRPIRDDMGVAGGVQNLPWLFLGTLSGMLVANPAFGWLAARVSRPTLVSTAYRVFGFNLICFFLLFTLLAGATTIWAGRVFFVWTAVFNMFAVSLFWSVMSDVFSTAQGRRLFGFIGAGGTIGSITGSTITSTLASVVGPVTLLLVSAALLELAALAARRLFVISRRQMGGDPSAAEQPVGTGALEGLQRTVQQPYLRGIAIHVVLYTLLTTFLYFQQATIVDANIADRVARTRFFANIDLTVNTITLVTQTVATGLLMRWLGIAVMLAILPALSLAGFITLGLMPSVGVLMAFQIARRSTEFAIARPSREVLFTGIPRADRYQAQNFIDTVVYRAGDQAGAWLVALLTAGGLQIFGTSMVAAALAAVSIGVAIWLGRRHVLAFQAASTSASRSGERPARS